jgi:hypothetical protein
MMRWEAACKSKRRAHNGVKQQDRKKKEINQTLHLLPNSAVERGVFANQITTKNERKIWEK